MSDRLEEKARELRETLAKCVFDQAHLSAEWDTYNANGKNFYRLYADALIPIIATALREVVREAADGAGVAGQVARRTRKAGCFSSHWLSSGTS